MRSRLMVRVGLTSRGDHLSKLRHQQAMRFPVGTALFSRFSLIGETFPGSANEDARRQIHFPP
jgi:hypothetical protein